MGPKKTDKSIILARNSWSFIQNITVIILYAKDSHRSNYHYLIRKRGEISVKHFKDQKAFIEYSTDMSDVYNGIEGYNLGKG